ncbi:MAG TPA: Flp family type IVb pilin [Rhizomicrobium sp.]|nr:Flp family type IVb pilin [Rhizomicrobium sp.]
MGEASRVATVFNAARRYSAHSYAAGSFVVSFFRDESGATAIEYAMIAMGIAVAVVAMVNTLGNNVKTVLFDKVATALGS